MENLHQWLQSLSQALLVINIMKRGTSPRRMVIISLSTILGFYAVITIAVFFNQRKLIYYPTPITEAPDTEGLGSVKEVAFENEGQQLRGWLIRPECSKLIIYYGGNNEELSNNIQDYRDAKDWAVLLINYRGFGASEGQPTESALMADALKAYDTFAASYQTVLLAGRSLGTGIATFVASQRPVSGLVLITPYDSLTEVAKHQYPWLPVPWLIKDRFESIRYCSEVDAPTLMILAGQDALIPNELSQNLIRAWPNAVETLVIPEASHSNISNFPQYYPAILKFMNQLASKP